MRGEAIKLASRGFRVFPLRPGGKKPLHKGWQSEATADAFTVLETWPSELSAPGIVTDDLVVLDADAGKGGLEALQRLFGGTLPHTLTVRTGGGGLHLYFRPPEDTWFTSRACRQTPDGKRVEVIPDHYGIDVRARGGLVVGPGATIGGNSYRIEVDAPIAELPAFVAELLKPAAPKAPEVTQAVAELDTLAALERARAYLLHEAPLALEGSGGDTQTIVVANRVMDFAVEPETALELMAECWNERCQPPWEYEDLAKKVGNAARYRQDAIGRDAPGRYFEPIQHPPGGPSNVLAGRMRAYCGTEATEKAIPPRAWIVRNKLIREFYTVLGAPGGHGKSLWSLQVATAVAIAGRYPDKARELIGAEVRESCNVLVINNEDPDDELDRRLAAVMRHFSVDRSAAHGRVFLLSGAKRKFKLALETPKTGEVTIGPEVADLVETVRQENIGLVIFDPLISTHSSDENSNTKMQRVMEIATSLAAELRIAELIVHHTNKPPMASSESYAGNVNAIRGASAVKDGGRVALTMFGMSAKDGERLGVPREHRHRYVRLDDAKANLHLASSQAEWFYKESVPVGEDSMGVLVPVQLKEATEDDNKLLIESIAPALTEELSLKAAIAHLKTVEWFKDISQAGLRDRIARAFVGEPDINGRKYKFTPNGIRGGRITPV